MDNFNIEIKIKEKKLRVIRDQLYILYIKKSLICDTQEESHSSAKKEIEFSKEEDKISKLAKKEKGNSSKLLRSKIADEENLKEKNRE